MKQFREQAGLTQNALADKIDGYNRNNIAQYEKDLSAPPLSFLRQFCSICNTTYEEIIDGEQMHAIPSVDQKQLCLLIEESGLHDKKKSQLKTEVTKLYSIIDNYQTQLKEQQNRLDQQKQKIIDFLKDRL